MKFVALFTLIGNLLPLAIALQCRRGYETGTPGSQPRRHWEIVQCRIGGSQRCIKGEGVASAFGISLDFRIGGCVDGSACAGPCQNLLSTILGSEADATGLDRFIFRSCDRICCDTDNCNNVSVAQIRAITEATPPPTQEIESPSTAEIITMETKSVTVTVEKALETTQTTEPVETTATENEYRSTQSTEVSLTCSRGYGLSSGPSDFRFTACPLDANFACIQQDVMVELNTGFYGNLTLRSCASANDCMGSCEEVGRGNYKKLTTSEGIGVSPAMGMNFIANSCKQECCSADLCNSAETSSTGIESKAPNIKDITTIRNKVEEKSSTSSAINNSINVTLMVFAFICFLFQSMG